MNENHYADWKRKIMNLRQDIDRDITATFARSVQGNFLKLLRSVSVITTNGTEVGISLLEYKDGVMTYYAGSMPYLKDELTVEGLSNIYYELSRSIPD